MTDADATRLAGKDLDATRIASESLVNLIGREAACSTVQAAILDQGFFRLNNDQFQQFTAMLDAPPSPNPGLERLMAVTAPWVAQSKHKFATQRTSTTRNHILDRFECGESVLDEWLKRRAMVNQVSGASRRFVVADQECRAYDYYAMAAGTVSHQMATSSVRRNMPDPVPVMVLARLAVDHHAQGIKLGASYCKTPSTGRW